MGIINEIPFLKRSLARKLPSYGGKSMVSPVIRCHPQQTATAQIWGFKNPKPESIPNYAQYIAKKMGGIVPNT